MNAQKLAYRTQSIMTTGKLSIAMLAGLLIVGGESARASMIIADGLHILANSGQTQTQRELDLYACATWATDQTGFDPITHPGGTPPAASTARHSQYRLAMAACLQARGYTVSMAPPAPAAVSPAPRRVAIVSPAESSAPPRKWEFLGTYQSPMGAGRESAVIDLTSSYNYDYVAYYVWVGGGFVQQGGNWAPGPGQWASSNVDIDCKHHTFKEHRFVNQAGSIPRSGEGWIAIKDGWRPIQLAAKQVCEQIE